MSRNTTFQFGGQDDTQPTSGANKRLDLWPDSTPQGSREHWIDKMPIHIVYGDKVGLPGTENYYVTYKLDNLTGFDQTKMPYWNGYTSLEKQSGNCFENGELKTIPSTATGCYAESGFGKAQIINLIPNVIYVELDDKGTGNPHNDKGFEAVLMHENFEPLANNRGFFLHNEKFHVGFHSRNSRRVEFKVMIKVWPVVDQSYFPITWEAHTESLYYAYPPDNYTYETNRESNVIYEHIIEELNRGVALPSAAPTYSTEMNSRPDYGFTEQTSV